MDRFNAGHVPFLQKIMGQSTLLKEGGFDNGVFDDSSHSPNLVAKWYEHRCPAKCCPVRWSAFAVTDAEKGDLEARTSSSPIIHALFNASGNWLTRSITIQDPWMRKSEIS